MMLTLLHTISGLVFVVGVVGKITTHLYLDRAHDGSVGFIAIVLTPLHFMGPYKPSVEKRLSRVGQLCNFFFWLALMALAVNLIVGLLILVN